MLLGLDDVKSLYVLSCLALCLIIVLPTLAMFASVPGDEHFSELWLLGAGHMAEDYPFNVEAHAAHRVYLGIGNRMGGLEYYRIYVKFRNQTESLPDVLNMTPSTLEPLLEYRVLVEGDGVWEREVQFSFENVSFNGSSCKVTGLVVDGHVMDVDKSALWDEENHGFYFQMFFELWLYSDDVADFQYHNRSVGVWLNLTRSA